MCDSVAGLLTCRLREMVKDGCEVTEFCNEILLEAESDVHYVTVMCYPSVSLCTCDL
jgi:hypothetical protein